MTTTTTMEPTFSSTLSGLQSPAPGILQQRGEVEPAGNEEGSNSSVDQVSHVQTRHCKRQRRNEVARTGEAAATPPLVQVEDPSTGASRMSILEINRTESLEGQRELLVGLQTKIAGLGVQCASPSRAKYTRATLQKRRRSPGQKKPELETDRSIKSNVMQPASTEKDGIVAVVKDPASATQVEEEAKAEELVSVHVDRAAPRSLKALHAKFRAAMGDEGGVRCARKDRRNDDTRKNWQCPMNAMKGRTLCDHHFLLVQANRARYAAAQHTKKAAAKRQGNSNFKNAGPDTSNGVGLSESHTQFDQVPAEVPELSLPLKPSIETPSQAASDEKLDHTEAPDTADEISENDHDDHADADADQLLPHMLKNASNRWYVAPRKTADANVKVNGGGRKAQLFRSLLKSL